jgi:hypothetical protein
MTKTIGLVGLILAALAPLSVEACRDMMPDMADLPSYASVFVGEVSGIRLIEYENTRLDRSSKCDTDLNDDDLECIGHIAGRPLIKIFVIPTKVIKGTVTGVQELEQAGCTGSDIPLKEQGIFFVYPNSTTAVIVWRFKTADYANWLERLDATKGIR